MIEPFKGAPARESLYSDSPKSRSRRFARSLAGSLVVTENPYNFHPEEHDVLIVKDANFNDHSHYIKRRLVFASKPEVAKPTGRVSSSSGGSSFAQSTAALTQFRPARDFEITEFSREHQLETLVRRSCVPHAGSAYSGFTTASLPHVHMSRGLFVRRADGSAIVVDVRPESRISRPTSSFSTLPRGAARRRGGVTDALAFPLPCKSSLVGRLPPSTLCPGCLISPAAHCFVGLGTSIDSRSREHDQ